jgi:hypothetical protein
MDAANLRNFPRLMDVELENSGIELNRCCLAVPLPTMQCCALLLRLPHMRLLLPKSIARGVTRASIFQHDPTATGVSLKCALIDFLADGALLAASVVISPRQL